MSRCACVRGCTYINKNIFYWVTFDRKARRFLSSFCEYLRILKQFLGRMEEQFHIRLFVLILSFVEIP